MASSPVVLVPAEARGLARALRAEQLAVHTARSLPLAVQACARQGCDLVALSAGWARPDAGVLQRVAALRPVRTLVLGLVAGVDEAVAWLEAGADDYLGPHVGLAEQRARVRALLRRPAPARDPGVVRVGPFRLSLEGRTVEREGRPVPLTRTEFDVLRVLAERPGVLVTAEEIAQQVWGSAAAARPRVRAFVLRLRRELEDDPHRPRHLLTVRGGGYLLRA